MSLKSEKLAQRIQEIQKFVADRINQAVTYKTVCEELAKINDVLKIGKLSVRIVSKDPAIAQVLQNCLSTRDLTECYEFGVSSLPDVKEQPEPEPLAALVFESSTNCAKPSQLRYELAATQKTLIGRHPDCQILLDNRLTLVSGRHAEIQTTLTSNSPSTDLSWQICDLNSKNGTYVNGKQLRGCQTLHQGDRITLAAESANESSPEFIFEYQSSATAQSGECYAQLTDCDVLCLVVDAVQTLTTQEKAFIEEASKTQITKLVVVIDTSNSSQDVQLTKNKKAEFEKWLHQKSDVSFELAVIILCDFYPDICTEVDSASQQELDKFRKSLETLVKRKPEDILLKRLTARVLSQLAVVEKGFEAQELALVKQIQQDTKKLQAEGQDDLKEQAKKAFKKVSDDKDKFFKQVKNELSQSKAALLDEFSRRSIVYRIQVFTDDLKPVVTKRGGFKYIQLELESVGDNNDVHMGMNQLCQAELSHWATEEWSRICNQYAEGGFSGLLERTCTTLNFIPSLNLAQSLLRPSQDINFQRSFQDSAVEIPCEVLYKGTSLFEYALKSLRSNFMTFGVIAGMLVALNVPLGNKQAVLEQILNGLTNFINSFIRERFLSTTLAYSAIFAPLFIFVTNSWLDEKTLRMQEAAAKLRKEMCTYYQSLSKNLIEKLVQEFTVVLETEERRFKETLEAITEQCTAYISEVEKGQLLIKGSLEKLKLQQKSLDKERSELQKLKRL